MPDTDVSHAVQEQLDAITARLDVLEEAAGVQPPTEEVDGEEEYSPLEGV